MTMRLGPMILTMGLVVAGNSVLNAQPAHSSAGVVCGCDQCASKCGLLSGLTHSLHYAVSSLYPGHIGADGRHKIYRAALVRNTFDKKCLLPIGYYSHILPIYNPDRCCSHGQAIAAPCHACAPPAHAEEDMMEIPDAMPVELTRGARPNGPVTPFLLAPVREAVSRVRDEQPTAGLPDVRPQKRAVQGTSKPGKVDRVAQESGKASPTETLGDFIQVMLFPADQAQSSVRHAGGSETLRHPEPQNPLR